MLAVALLATTRKAGNPLSHDPVVHDLISAHYRDIVFDQYPVIHSVHYDSIFRIISFTSMKN